MKTCSVCRRPKELSDFHRDRARLDGCARTCKSCKAILDLGRHATTRPLARWASVAERLQRRLKVMNSGCQEWTGATARKGYGQIRVDHKTVQTHRLAWELANGPIPDGMLVCHTCDNPPCCNVAHLWLGTNDENMADMVGKGRTHGRTADRQIEPVA